MIIRCIFILIGLLGGCTHEMSQEKEPKALLILNMLNQDTLPRKFRTCQDPFKIENSSLPTRKGLDQLNLSGSAQFAEKSLDAIIRQLENPHPLYIVDLRQESHGFLNGVAVSWYARKDWDNIGLTIQEIEQQEKKLLNSTLKEKFITLHQIIRKDGTGDLLPETKTISFVVETAENEKQIATKRKLSYIRLPVTDHLRPSDDIVDRFIDFVKQLPKERWIHIHCAAGVGRTTTFMVMYDMMLNAKIVSFDDIIKRQWLLGGLNFKRLANPSSWKYPYSLERLQFLQDFYEYCRTNSDNFQQSWSHYQLYRQKVA